MAMTFHRDEFMAPPEMVDLVIDQALIPLLRSLEEDNDVELTAEVVACAREEEAAAGTVSGNAGKMTSGPALGTVWIRFRRTHRDDRVLYCIESIYPGDPVSGSGFSGFKDSGELLTRGEVIEVRRRGSWVVQYNTATRRGWCW
jgi:hypothetical protein